MPLLPPLTAICFRLEAQHSCKTIRSSANEHIVYCLHLPNLPLDVVGAATRLGLLIHWDMVVLARCMEMDVEVPELHARGDAKQKQTSILCRGSRR